MLRKELFGIASLSIGNIGVAGFGVIDESMEHFKQELIEYIDYYNNKRIKARLKGLPPALHRQQALSAA